MRPQPNIPPDLCFSRAKEIEAILNEAVRQALLAHKRAGNSIAVWEDGKVVIIPPEEIDVEDPLASRPRDGSEPKG